MSQVDRPEMRESTALGAALVAGSALGLFGWDLSDPSTLSKVNTAGKQIFASSIDKKERARGYKVSSIRTPSSSIVLTRLVDSSGTRLSRWYRVGTTPGSPRRMTRTSRKSRGEWSRESRGGVCYSLD